MFKYSDNALVKTAVLLDDAGTVAENNRKLKEVIQTAGYLIEKVELVCAKKNNDDSMGNSGVVIQSKAVFESALASGNPFWYVVYYNRVESGI